MIVRYLAIISHIAFLFAIILDSVSVEAVAKIGATAVGISEMTWAGSAYAS